MKFTGQPAQERVNVDVQFRDDNQDAELVRAMVAAIRSLATAIGAARSRDLSGEPEGRRWGLEALVGYGILAVGEVRSLLLLLSGDLAVHARVHLRSLYEYQLRASILLADEAKALRFRDALAYETRAFGKSLGIDPAVVEAEIAAVLGTAPGAVVGEKEKAVIGDGRKAMENELSPERRYIGTFAWPSQITHGTVLALHETAKRTAGHADDVLTVAANDDKGPHLLYSALWLVLWFAANIGDQFGFEEHAHFDEAVASATAANARLSLVTPEQEQRVMDLRAARAAASAT